MLDIRTELHIIESS